MPEEKGMKYEKGRNIENIEERKMMFAEIKMTKEGKILCCG